MNTMEQLFHSHGWTITLESATLPDGRIAKRARASFADTVHILAFDDTGNILMLREYRPFYDTYIWMLPSGHVDKEADPPSLHVENYEKRRVSMHGK